MERMSRQMEETVMQRIPEAVPIITNECPGSGPMPVSSLEASRGWVYCSACGRALRIRARHHEAEVPRHARGQSDALSE